MADGNSSAPGTAPGGPDHSGRVLGKFRILREIGRGGMGVVYEAEDASLGRRVALKVLEAHLTLQREAVERFQREAAAAAALRHRHILPVFSVGQEEEVYFFAMELVEGCSLDEVLVALRGDGGGEPRVENLVEAFREAPFAASARVVAQIAEALDYAHERHILHRDLKPSNILLRGDGSAILIDFGLARAEGLPQLTQTGQLVGSPYYVAPEEVVPGHGARDHRVDLYALGVVLYELLTLQRPFEGSNLQEVLARISQDEPQTPRQVRPEVPRDLETICLTAMSREPERRYQRGNEFAADLRRYLAGEPISARPPDLLRRTGVFLRRHQRLSRRVVAAAALTAIAALLALVLWPWIRPQGELELTSDLDGVSVELFAGTEARGRPLHQLSLPIHEPLALRPGDYSLLVRRPGHDQRRREGAEALHIVNGERRRLHLWLPPLEERLEWSAWASSLRALACVPPAESDTGVAFVALVANGHVVALDGAGAPLWEVRQRAFGDTAQLLVARLSGTAGISVATAEERQVLLFGAGGEVRMRRELGGRVRGLAVVAGAGRRHLVIAGDDGHLLAVDGRGEVQGRFDVGEPVHRLLGHPVPGGEHAVVVTESGIYQLDVTGELECLMEAAGTDLPRSHVALVGGAPPAESRLLVLGPGGELLDVHRDLRRRLGAAVEAVTTLRGEGGEELAVLTRDHVVHLLGGGEAHTFAVPFAAHSLGSADLDADGSPELLLADRQRVHAYDRHGAPRFSLEVGRRVKQLRGLDLDRDGREEVVAITASGILAFGADAYTRFRREVTEPRHLNVVGPGQVLVQSGPRRFVWLHTAGSGRREFSVPEDVAAWTTVGQGEELRLFVAGLEGGVAVLDAAGRVQTEDDSGLFVTALARTQGDTEAAVILGGLGGELVGLDTAGGRRFAHQLPGNPEIRELLVAEDARILALTETGVVFLLDPDGRPRARWSLASPTQAAALLDHDGDGRADLVSVSAAGELEVHSASGERLMARSLPAPCVGLEVDPGQGAILVGLEDQGVLYLRDGEELALAPDWPLEQLWVRDLDGDRVPEVLLFGGGALGVLDGSGGLRAELPWVADQQLLAPADVDGDGCHELLVGRGDSLVAVAPLPPRTRAPGVAQARSRGQR